MTQGNEVKRSWQARALQLSRVVFFIPIVGGAGLILGKVIGLIDISYPLPTWFIYLTPAAAAIKIFQAKYNALKRKYESVDAQTMMEQDARPPVLYLRSFKHDADASRSIVNYTVEEDLTEVLKEFGPVITLGQPGEEVPLPGAARMYVDPDEWQKVVTDLMLRARLVVLRLGDTEGFWWEVQRAVQLVKPERLLFIAYDDKGEESFRERAPLYLSGPLILPKTGGGWVLYFEPNWTSHFISMSSRLGDSFRYESERVMMREFKTSLRPVFMQLGVEWKAPPIRWADVLLVLGGLALLLFIILDFFVQK